MNIERKFGHDFAKSVLWGAHIGMFYRTSEDIRKIFIPYLAAGLKANERCVWVTAVFSPEETLKLLDERLPDLDIYIDKKQLMIFSPDDVYLKKGRLDEVDNIVGKWANIYNEALSGGYEGLRIGADISWLESSDFEQFIACERAVNRIISENRIIAICAYDIGNFEISDIIAINSAHPYAILEKDGRWELIENAERIRIREALEESEEKYRSIFNRVSCGITLTDLQGNILDVNAYLCHRAGCTREATILTKPGEERLVEWNNTTLRDATGNAIGAMSLGVDITDQKRMEEQLIRTERLQALREMTSGIAHNFNNLLTVVLGYAELLKDETNLTDIASGLEKIEQSGIKARDLVKRMMDFVRIRKDKEFEVVDLTQVVQESIAISKLRWKATAEASGISIEMKKEWADNLLVDGDASELTEVVTNMIINSVEAMPKGGTITFRGEHLGGFVFLSISDTGMGMSEYAQKRVFEPFFTTKTEVGRGMGLATAYGTIRRHGGEIEVQSQLGEGTTFTIKLPHSKGLTEDKKEEIIPKARQANILVIDDEEHILMVFTQVLKEHQVDTTTDALEGIRLFKGKRHDVLIVDLAMPKMNGWQIADVVRMIDKNVGIILCTGWGVQIEDEEFKRSQVDFLLAKPFEIKAALSIIGQAVELKDKRAKELKGNATKFSV